MDQNTAMIGNCYVSGQIVYCYGELFGYDYLGYMFVIKLAYSSSNRDP